MRKLGGFLLCTVAVILYVGAAFGLLSIKSLWFAPSGGSLGELGIGAVALAVAVVLGLLGAKVFRAGHARLRNVAG